MKIIQAYVFPKLGARQGYTEDRGAQSFVGSTFTGTSQESVCGTRFLDIASPTVCPPSASPFCFSRLRSVAEQSQS